MKAGGTNAEVQATMAKYTALYDEIEKLMKDMIAGNADHVAVGVDSVVAGIDSSRSALRTAIIAAGVLSIASLAVLLLSIAMPVRRMARQLGDLAAGRIEERDVPTHRADEIGQAELAVFETSNYLRDMSRAATSIAVGELRVDVHPRGADDVMGNAFQAMLATLRRSVEAITASAMTLVGASRDLSATSSRLDTSAGSAAEETRNAAEAVESVNGGIQTVAGSAQEMAATVREISSQTTAISTMVGGAANASASISWPARRRRRRR